MSNSILPQFLGIGWPVNRKPYFSTIQSKTAGGQEVRIPNYPFPLEEFDLPINHLHQDSTTAPNLADFQKLYAFYVARLGAWDSWLYFDPTDNYTVQNAIYEGLNLPSGTGQNVIGTGDGSTTAFQLFRTIGGTAVQPVYAINGITATQGAPPISSPFVNVWVNGAAVVASGHWSVSASGMLTFLTAPANGYPIAADFSFFKRMRFKDDNLDLQNFMQAIWKVGKIGVQQVYS